VVVEDVAQSPIFAGTPALQILLNAGVRAVQSTPIVDRAGATIGMLSTHYRKPAQPGERELRLLDLLARQAADLIERLRREEALKQSERQLLRAAKELEATNRALVHANEDLQQFAFAASHDLQEPLRMITSYSQLLVRGYRGQLEGEPEVFVNFISRGTSRMQELLADLLTYVELNEADHTDGDLVDLNSVFQKALDNLRPAISESGASICSARLPVVHGRGSHYLQLFQNLLGNAIKYRGDGPPAISVSGVKVGRHWRLAVADNGIGIAPEYHAQIFGAFKRLHGARIPGTGMGLAICQRVVERYGGRIWVESEARNGATFYFTVPVAEAEAAHAG